MHPNIVKCFHINCNGRVYDMFKQGRFLYVANGDLGLQVIDCYDYNKPVIISQFRTIGRPRAISASGKLVFVAQEHVGGFGNGGALEVFDVSNPIKPLHVGVISTPSFAYDVTYNNGFVYVADEESGLHILKIEGNGRIDRVGLCGGYGNTKRILTSGDRVYMVDRELGLLVISASDPESPRLVGTCYIPRDNFGLCLHQGRALVVNRYNGLYFVNIDDPSAPYIEQVVDTRESNIDVVSDNQHIFVSSMDPNVPGIQAFIHDQRNSLSLFYSLDTSGNLWALTLNENFIYGANGDFGIISLKVSY